jgi:hypothetical protein
MKDDMARGLHQRRDHRLIVEERRYEVEAVVNVRAQFAHLAGSGHLAAWEPVERDGPFRVRRRQEHLPGRVDVAENPVLPVVLDDPQSATLEAPPVNPHCILTFTD